ncbi:hypothetical protein MC885_018044 [Smutsia gigantea]|nr:hypothetical protein MC885_018044 [Smutsia gigantea]
MPNSKDQWSLKLQEKNDYLRKENDLNVYRTVFFKMTAGFCRMLANFIFRHSLKVKHDAMKTCIIDNTSIFVYCKIQTMEIPLISQTIFGIFNGLQHYEIFESTLEKTVHED